MRQKLVSMAEEKKENLKTSISRLPRDCAVCVTMDLWSSRKMVSFLGMTVHFVEAEPGKETSLQSHLLAFK